MNRPGLSRAALFVFRHGRRSFQAEAHQLVLAAGIEKSLSQRRMRADLSGQDLGAGARFETGGRGGGANKFAALSEDEQLIARKHKRRRPEGGLLPNQLPGP